MKLSPRQISFLKLLLEERQYRPVGYYAEQLSVTARTLREDLNVISDFLGQLGLTLERKAGSGVLLPADARNHETLLSFLATSQNRERYVTLSTRRREILRQFLLNTQQSYSIQKLSDHYYVSRTSIVNDLRYIEAWLAQYGLTLTKSVAGTAVRGSEAQIRKAFAGLIASPGGGGLSETDMPALSRIDNLTLDSLLSLFRLEDIVFMETLLNDLEATTGCVIGEPYYLNLMTHLLICIERVTKGQRIEEAAEEFNIDLRMMLAYRHAVSIADAIEAHFNISLGDSETYYIYQYLVSFGIGIQNTPLELQPGCGDQSKALVSEIVGWVSDAMDINLSLSGQLETELLLHVRSMMSRMGYDIQIRNNLLPDIQKIYPKLLALLDGTLWAVSKKYGLKAVSLDETAYIAMYFQVAIERLNTRPKVVVVCQSGYGTSQLLRARLSKVFSQWDIRGVVSARRLASMDLSALSFVVSTVALSRCPVPYVVISPLLSDHDIEKIKASGLPAYGTERKNWRALWNEWLYTGLLAFTTDHEIWREWERRRATEGRLETKQIAMEGMSLTLCQGAAAMQLQLYYDKSSHWVHGVLLSRRPDEMRTLYTGLFRLLQGGCDWPLLAEEAESSRLLNSLLPQDCILANETASDKADILGKLARRLYDRRKIRDLEAFCADVLSREAEGSTYIGDGIALPHGKTEQADGLALAMATLKQPVTWEVEDGEALPVRILVLFAVSSDSRMEGDSRYIGALQTVCNMLDDGKTVNRLLSAKSADEIFQMMTRQALHQNEGEQGNG